MKTYFFRRNCAYACEQLIEARWWTKEIVSVCHCTDFNLATLRTAYFNFRLIFKKQTWLILIIHDFTISCLKDNKPFAHVPGWPAKNKHMMRNYIVHLQHQKIPGEYNFDVRFF